MPATQLDIPICPSVRLIIYSESNPVFEMDDAVEHGESCWQLLEGKQYNYELIDNNDEAVDWELIGPASIITRDKRHTNQGIISTGLYVGTLELKACAKYSSELFPVRLEIQSSKTTYRSDYRKMLSDITSYYTDLVMQQGSPISQNFDIDYDTPQETLYQKFSFIKSIVDQDDFDEAVHKIMSNPVRKWTETTTEKHIDAVRRISRNGLRQIVSRNDRIPVSNGPCGLQSLPRTITVAHKKDTIDTSENQFIKYALTSFYAFCSSLSVKPNASEQLKIETNAVCNKLAGYMNSLFFKDVSRPAHLNLGSPVLQRKEGYREILQSWLMFDLAAKITWEGGDNVYKAGKKNVAVLYEYWVFFKLMEAISRVFKISPENKKDLVKVDSDGISLEIRQGHKMMVGGTYEEGPRKLNIRLFYNRTFSNSRKREKAGTWTLNMRPDYTLSIWPGDLSETEAEEKDAIVHIHFDAKYRLDKIIIEDKPLSDGEESAELDQEKLDREKNIYKRGDLLKMHAYKDAIRRTAAAYILYPGETPTIKRGFEEILPGLGAFCISPNASDDQLPDLETYLRDVVSHFMNRATQREELAITEHKIHSSRKKAFIEQFPEPYGDETMFPDSTPVLVGCYKSMAHLDWILSHGLYNIRLEGGRKGSVHLEEKYLSIKYLLLYDYKNTKNTRIFKVVGDGPHAVTSEGIAKLGYPKPTSNQMYLVFSVSESAVEPELIDRPWFLETVADKSGAPVVVNYINLFPF